MGLGVVIPEELQVSTTPLLLQLRQLCDAVLGIPARGVVNPGVPGSWNVGSPPGSPPEGTQGGKNPKGVPGVHIAGFSGFEESCSQILEVLGGLVSVTPHPWPEGMILGALTVHGVLFRGF